MELLHFKMITIALFSSCHGTWSPYIDKQLVETDHFVRNCISHLNEMLLRILVTALSKRSLKKKNCDSTVPQVWGSFKWTRYHFTGYKRIQGSLSTYCMEDTDTEMRHIKNSTYSNDEHFLMSQRCSKLAAVA